MKKNLFDININNSSNAHVLLPQKACDPCASECKKINRKINGRKLSELKSKEVAHILNLFSEN